MIACVGQCAVDGRRIPTHYKIELYHIFVNLIIVSRK